MLVWPWISLAIVWAWGGVQMHNHVAEVAIAYPQTTSFFATLLGSIVSMVVSILFSIAVVRFAQEWVANNDHVTVFEVSVISAFRYQNWPWSMKDHEYLLVGNRWLPVVLAGACIAAFALVTPGVTSFVAPVSFHRTVPLMGTELDFSSSAADCINWFETNRISNTCEWVVSSLPQNTCLTNYTPLSDVSWSAIHHLPLGKSTGCRPGIRSQ
jgi:hypothetical protein